MIQNKGGKTIVLSKERVLSVTTTGGSPERPCPYYSRTGQELNVNCSQSFMTHSLDFNEFIDRLI